MFFFLSIIPDIFIQSANIMPKQPRTFAPSSCTRHNPLEYDMSRNEVEERRQAKAAKMNKNKNHATAQVGVHMLVSCVVFEFRHFLLTLTIIAF